MRLPPLPPAAMTKDQRALHDAMAPVIAEHLKGFVSRRSDGALVGPFPPMLHFLQFGQPAWEYTRALIEQAKLPKKVREVAILVTGACFNSRYELYAHEHVAESTGLSLATIATIAAGQRQRQLQVSEQLGRTPEQEGQNPRLTRTRSSREISLAGSLLDENAGSGLSEINSPRRSTVSPWHRATEFSCIGLLL